MQLEHFVRLAARQEALAVPKIRTGRSPWSRESRKWVLVNIAVNGPKRVDGELKNWISFTACSNKRNEQDKKENLISHTQRTVRIASLPKVMLARRF